MIEREEYCVDILQQTAALRAAVDALSDPRPRGPRPGLRPDGRRARRGGSVRGRGHRRRPPDARSTGAGDRPLLVASTSLDTAREGLRRSVRYFRRLTGDARRVVVRRRLVRVDDTHHVIESRARSPLQAPDLQAPPPLKERRSSSRRAEDQIASRGDAPARPRARHPGRGCRRRDAPGRPARPARPRRSGPGGRPSWPTGQSDGSSSGSGQRRGSGEPVSPSPPGSMARRHEAGPTGPPRHPPGSPSAEGSLRRAATGRSRRPAMPRSRSRPPATSPSGSPSPTRRTPPSPMSACRAAWPGMPRSRSPSSRTNWRRSANWRRCEPGKAERATFVSTVAHELRTPLTGLAGYLDLILDGLGRRSRSPARVHGARPWHRHDHRRSGRRPARAVPAGVRCPGPRDRRPFSLADAIGHVADGPRLPIAMDRGHRARTSPCPPRLPGRDGRSAPGRTDRDQPGRQRPEVRSGRLDHRVDRLVRRLGRAGRRPRRGCRHRRRRPRPHLRAVLPDGRSRPDHRHRPGPADRARPGPVDGRRARGRQRARVRAPRSCWHCQDRPLSPPRRRSRRAWSECSPTRSWRSRNGPSCARSAAPAEDGRPTYPRIHVAGATSWITP